ncbi:MAG: glycosyltransferase family 4 protein [Calothrix sp. C42_A2020_038]|nr:glycosyltransferase family 4 protein [Calothrix sp. C42_A2020_038]
MNILLINTSDISGGAARSAYRLHEGLRSIHVKSQMLVQEKYSDDKTVIAPKLRFSQAIARAKLSFDNLPLKLCPQYNNGSFSLQWLPDKILSRVNQLQPDVINLHWVSGAYMQVETLAKLKQPLVWTLHDMWAFTGGCHYNQECNHYTTSCGTCPQLGSDRKWDLSYLMWQRKAKAWKNLDLTIVTPSNWLAKCALASSLFKNRRVEVIPYGLNTQKYRPINQQFARDLLKLPNDKQLILFGALQASSDKRKGFHLLQGALHELSSTEWKNKIELVVFGPSQSENSTNFGFKSHNLGTLNDDLSLALAYSAADAFIAPSIQDNLPNTVMEALACGTPSVAFDIGGMPDMIEHQKNGYLAQPFKIGDLANGIIWVLENPERHQKISRRAREKTEREFTLEIQARRYLSIFESLVNKFETSQQKMIDFYSTELVKTCK